MTSIPTVRPRRGGPGTRARQRVERRLIAATAIGLLYLMKYGFILGVNQFRLLGVLLGITILAATLRNPMLSARFAIVWIPLSPVILSLLYHVGMPGPLVKSGTYIRSGIVLSLAVAGWVHRTRAGRPLAALDRLALGYLAVVLTYLAIGPLILTTPVSFTTQLQGVQAIGIFVCAFLAMRWLDLSLDDRATLRRWAAGVIGFLAVVGLYQRLDQSGFNRILFEDIGIERYLRDIAELSSAAYSDAVAYFFTADLRVTSLSLNPFGFADLMLCGVAVGVVGLSHRTRASDVALVGVCALGIFFSGTRISIIAMGFLVLAAVLRGGISELAKVRFIAVAAVAAVALLPLILSSRLVQTEDNQFSDEGHGDELIGAVQSIVEQPLGAGIGSDGAVSRRTAFNRPLVSGNAVLSLGIQVGVIGMVTFLVFFVTVVRGTRGQPGTRSFEFSLLALLLLVASFVSAMTHNNWQDAGAGPVTWLLIGLGLSAPGVVGLRAAHQGHAAPHLLLAGRTGPSDRHPSTGHA